MLVSYDQKLLLVIQDSNESNVLYLWKIESQRDKNPLWIYRIFRKQMMSLPRIQLLNEMVKNMVYYLCFANMWVVLHYWRQQWRQNMSLIWTAPYIYINDVTHNRNGAPICWWYVLTSQIQFCTNGSRPPPVTCHIYQYCNDNWQFSYYIDIDRLKQVVM